MMNCYNYRLRVVLFLFVITFLLSNVHALQAANKAIETSTAKEDERTFTKEETNESSLNSEAVLNASGVYVLPEVFVTATKKVTSEAVQDIPASISAYSGETIEEKFMKDLTEIGQISPNVKLDKASLFPNTTNFYIRGMGTLSSIMSDEPSVGIFVDGMYYGINTGSMVDLFDVETVEVLRGPQGTLFGRNVTGGAVLVRHRRPTGEFSIRGRTMAGTYEWYEQNLVVEAPVTDKLACKLAMLYRDKGGYYDNTLNASDDIGDDRTWLLRPMLTWKPTENFEATITAEFSDFDGDGVPVRLIKDKTAFNSPPSTSKNFTTDLEPESGYHTEQAVIDINWKIGPGKLTLISGYRQIKIPTEVDIDGTGNVIFHASGTNQQDQWSEELRYATTINKRAELTTGIMFFSQNLLYDENRNLLNGAVRTSAASTMDHFAVGVFAQGNVDLTDTLTLTLGGRYTCEEKDVKVDSLGGTDSYDFIDDDRWDFLSGHANLSWRPSEHALLYGSWTRSFRSGGYNMRNVLPASPGPYDEERVDAFEGGIKSDWFNGRIRTNLSGFYNDFKDLQRTVIGSSLVVNEEILNAADATIIGFEAEMTVLPFENLQVDFSLGYTDASYDRFEGFDVDGDGTPDPDEAEDLDFRNVPEWNAYLGGVYYLPIPQRFGGELELRASASYNDGYAITHNNALTQDSYTLVDASISYLFFNENLKFSIFGKNLLDEHYTHTGLNVSLFDIKYYPQEGATGGIELRFEF